MPAYDYQRPAASGRFDKFFIGGEWVEPKGNETLKVVSPSTQEVIGSVPVATAADMDRAVAAAKAALDGRVVHLDPRPASRPARPDRRRHHCPPGRVHRPHHQRGRRAVLLLHVRPGLASGMVFDAFARHTREFPFEEQRAGALGGPILVRREPVGVCAGIIPWNVPLFITALKLGRPSPRARPSCSSPPRDPARRQRPRRDPREAGLPAGVVNIVPADREVGEHLVRHPDVDKVSFTGSTAAGRKIGAICGEQLKRCTLELGGKSAAIICEDANLDEAIPQIIGGGLMNNGQACVALTRVLAPRSRYDEIRTPRHGGGRPDRRRPDRPGQPVGPLIAERQRDRVEGYIAKGKAEGATVVVGGDRPTGVGNRLVRRADPVRRRRQHDDHRPEEIFGPVLSLIAYDDLDDAIRIANDSDYGLAGAVYTADIERASTSPAVRTGTFAVNTTQGMDFNGPFGGFKSSGIGRELGPEGIHAFCEDKTISLQRRCRR
jgi:aldehyde dehydrogenase (NAD+)